MAKIVLSDITGGYDLSKINSNFQKIEDALNDEVLYRDNPEGEVNTLVTDVDVNGKFLYNVPTPVLPGHAVNKDYTDSVTAPAISAGELATEKAAAAAASALAASNSASAAQLAETNAEIAESNAEAAALLAQGYADAAAQYVPLNWRDAWLTATVYAINDAVEEAGSSYVCKVGHTSGTFSTDFLAGYWGAIAEKGVDGTGTGDVSGPASSIDGEIVLFDGLSGKLIKRASNTGLLKATSGVLVTATPSTDYTIPSDISNMLETADIGVSVQAYDADTAKTDVAQTFSAPQRGTLTTDNDGSFDQSVTNKFKCTPTGSVVLTFTNHTAGQGGTVIFINSSNYVVTAAATTYISANDLTKLSATGNYLIGYEDDGTNAYCTVSAALTSAGA